MDRNEDQRTPGVTLTLHNNHGAGAEDMSVCVLVTHHFFDLSLGAGFLGMRKSALIGCMSHSAKESHITVIRQNQLSEGW